MSDNKAFSNWYEAYRHIAELLIAFSKQKKGNNPSESLFDFLKDSEFAELNKGRLFRDRLSRISERGLDPIQIFATFNYPKIGSKRIDIINSLLKKFGSDKLVQAKTSFEGCPSPVITQIIQYRGWKVQNQIWEMFDKIMEKGIDGLRNHHFILIKEWRGIDIASLTMFLFWINSDEFIPLDRNTVEFLKTFELINERPRTYNDYFHLCTNTLQLTDENVIRNFVRDAYQYIDKEFSGDILSGSTVNVISKETKRVRSGEELEVFAKRRQRERINGFRILALRPKEIYQNGQKREQKHLKNLTEGALYQFYHSFKFDPKSDDTIIYDAKEDIDLYNEGDLKISISSIVGKNGSGKSTIGDFLYLIINKIAIAKQIKPTEKLIDEEVYADLFVKLDSVYKIGVGSSIEIFKYNLDSDEKTYQIANEKIAIEMFDLEYFCYSIIVNYSLYALNTNITGDWIYPLFHKNDSYKTPIVLSPLRNEGIIDVNNEEGLAKARMLSNILEPKLILPEMKVPELTPNSIPAHLILEFDKPKMARKRKHFRKQKYGSLTRKVIDSVINELKIDRIGESDFIEETKEYIYLKIVTIADKYPKFKKFKGVPKWVNSDPEKLKEYASKLLEETSHITFKLKQAINYLKYSIYRAKEPETILSLSEQIQDIQEEFGMRTIELVPPSFFKTDVVFDHGGKFDDLSSGEKQQIFSINTIAYHIYNIDSIMYDRDSYKYRNINIVLDEVELYFHPEMQRTYLSNLLNRISSLQLEDIDNLNILFITHSPFILSDIPSSSILRLKTDPVTKRSIPAPQTDQTFGANIHDLLANDFFLDNGYMGKFANDKIQSVLKGIVAWNEKEDMIEKRKQKDELYKIIQLIGEPLVKDSLMDLYREKIGLHESEISISEIDEQIKRLQELKLRLQ